MSEQADTAAWKIPANWVWTDIASIAHTTSGGTPRRDRSQYYGGKIPWLKSGELGDRTVFEVEEYITDEGLKNSSAKVFPKGTLCIALYGATVGKLAILGIETATNQAVCGIFPPLGVDPRFLFRFFELIRQQLVELGKGGAQPNISQGIVRSTSIPLAPKGEQDRIVAEIEKQFTRLDAAVTALKRVQANLKRFRAAVLKAACEGRLVPTEAELARKEGRSYETGEQLLARILKERRAKWEADQLAKMHVSGKVPLNDDWKKKYKESTPPDRCGLPNPMEGWVWASVGQVSWSVKDGPHYSPKYAPQGTPFITGGQVRPSGVDFEAARYISPELHSELVKKCKPERGDLLYTKGGTTGIARVNTYDTEFSVWVHVAVLKLVESVLPFYLQNSLNSPFGYAQAQRFTHGVGNQDLGLTRMVNIVFGLPPMAEQRRIVEEIDRRMSGIDVMETDLEMQLTRADRLRQSILKRAFEGKLVPQDSNDEPASTLLERIRAERDACRSTSNGSRGRVRRHADKRAAVSAK